MLYCAVPLLLEGEYLLPHHCACMLCGTRSPRFVRAKEASQKQVLSELIQCCTVEQLKLSNIHIPSMAK